MVTRVLSCLLVVIVSLVDGGVIAATAGTSKGSVNITVPASVPPQSEVNVTVNGQAGPYNRVGVANYASTCPGSVSSGSSTKIEPNHTFSVKMSITAGKPGIHHACAWLFSGGSTPALATDVLASKTFKTT